MSVVLLGDNCVSSRQRQEVCPCLSPQVLLIPVKDDIIREPLEEVGFVLLNPCPCHISLCPIFLFFSSPCFPCGYSRKAVRITGKII